MIDTAKLRATAKRLKVFNPYQLRKKYEEAGFKFADIQAQRLWEGTGDTQQSTVDKLCLVLNCEPGDVLESLSVIKRKARNGHRA